MGCLIRLFGIKPRYERKVYSFHIIRFHFVLCYAIIIRILSVQGSEVICASRRHIFYLLSTNSKFVHTYIHTYNVLFSFHEFSLILILDVYVFHSLLSWSLFSFVSLLICQEFCSHAAVFAARICVFAIINLVSIFSKHAASGFKLSCLRSRSRKVR